MYDIHCHIVFGVDDGSDSVEESIKMAKLAYESGTDAIVATPHCNIPDSYSNYWGREFLDKVNILRDELRRRGLPVKIYCGQEIFCTSRTHELLKAGKLITINNSRYALVEFDFHESFSSVCQKLAKIIAEGYIPIVAHPERYNFISREADAAERLKSMGCLLQINKGSLSGSFGRSAHYSAYDMLSRRLVDFVASDAHSPYMRTPRMEDAYEAVCEQFSIDYADLIFSDNPRRVIENKKVFSY